MTYTYKCSKCKYCENRGSYYWCRHYLRETSPDEEHDCCTEI